MLEMEKMIYNIKNILINKKNDVIVKTNYTTKHYTNIGILCDQVGAGKSYSIMGLLNESKSLKATQIPFRNTSIGSNNITIKTIRKLDTNILLVPHGLVGQWSKYFEDSNLKFHVIQKKRYL